MKDNTTITTELTIPSEFEYERVAAKTVSTIAETVGLSPKQCKGLESAVIEACINAFDHGYQRKKDGKVLITTIVSESALTVDVKDFGVGSASFDSKKDPRGRGWGLHIIRKVVDDVTIESESGEGTRIVMTIYHNEKGERNAKPDRGS